MGRRNRDNVDDEEEGLAHRVITMLLRLAQLACACIVMGILARFCYQLTVAQATANSRIVYTLVIAGITIVFSVLFCAPFNILALSFPFDFVLFVCWLVAFALLAAQDNQCSTVWFTNYWGVYWGRWWNTPAFGPRYDGCGYWKTVLAFSFIASMMHLLSFILGIYIFRTYVRVSESIEHAKKHTEKLRRPSQATQATQASGANGAQINGANNGPTVETNAAGLPKPPRTPTPPGDTTPVQPATQV